MDRSKNHWRAALVVFALVFVFTGWLTASRIFLGDNDEGIYLDGGERMVHGQVPNKDFFIHTGPGSFAIEAVSLRLFGISLVAARVPLVFDIALLAACVFWLTANLAGLAAASVTAFAFVAFELTWRATFVNHRWDSSAWAFLAATLAFAALESAPAWIAICAGVAAGIAAWCTPTVALVALALGAVLVFHRRLLGLYVAGIGITGAGGALWLISKNAWGPLIEWAAWATSNYSEPNRVAYGSILGGYLNLFKGSSAPEAIVTGCLLAVLTLPGTLPFVSAIWVWKRPPAKIIALVAAGAAFVFSARPRWDMLHLVYVAAPFYVLAAGLLAGFRFRKRSAL